jgi:ATP-binding cassette subfamily B protein
LLWPRHDLRTRALLALSLLLVAAGKALLLAGPFFYKRIIDSLSAPYAAVPVALVAAYGIATFVSQSVDQLRQLAFAPVAQRATRLLFTDVFRHLHTLSLRFHLDRESGGIAQIVSRGTASIEFLAELILFSLLPSLFEAAAVVAILSGAFSFTYAAVTVGALAVYLAVTIAGSRTEIALRRRTNALDVEASVRAFDSLINYETVKYFAAEAAEMERYAEARRAYERSAVRAKLVETMVEVSKSIVLAGGAIGVVLLAARDLAGRSITVGDFVMINAYLLQLYAPVQVWATVYGGARQAYADSEMLIDLLAIEPEVADSPEARCLDVGPGRIRFENVSFGYDPRRRVLHDISFEIPPGRRVALVGPSGSGKSTVARLLFRFYDVGRGRITIDGQDIRSVTLESLRRAIGVVPQDTVLFNASAAYNIAYGTTGAEDADILAAARAASLDRTFEQLPDGYGTIVGERGLKLSGGEKQRIAIARVIMKSPPILVLDEATSALDTHTERDIQARLEALSIDRSTLVIAHRLSTIADADEILVLSDGRIVERGRHDELIPRRGVYASMWESQQRRESEEAPTGPQMPQVSIM